MLMHRRKVSNSFRGGRKYSISFSFFQFILEINENSSNNRRQELCKDVCVAAEQADEANEKDANN